jgi:hypothetical protein
MKELVKEAKERMGNRNAGGEHEGTLFLVGGTMIID